MYPIKFENIYFEKVWGGEDFKEFRDNIVGNNIGESWDIACHDNGMSIVANGPLKGKSLKDLISEFGELLVGRKVDINNFPLLVKLINSKDYLSVQVHPNDEYASKEENQQGKTEAWYVMSAKDGSKIVVGTNNCTKKQFIDAIKNNTVEDCLNYIDVKQGDCFLINSGLVHAIGEGLVILEVQQNSDVTYRVYDYGRPRELHITKSLDVIDFNGKAVNLSNNLKTVENGYRIVNLCKSDYFEMKKIEIDTIWHDTCDKNKFSIITCVNGKGYIESKDFKECIKTGDSYLMPASLCEYNITGNVEVIKSCPV